MARNSYESEQKRNNLCILKKKWEIKVTLKDTEKLNQRTSACTAWRIINVSTICLYRKTSLHIACYVCVCVRRVWKCMHICWDQRVTIAWPSPVQRFTRNESTYQLRERERERERLHWIHLFKMLYKIMETAQRSIHALVRVGHSVLRLFYTFSLLVSFVRSLVHSHIHCD